MSQIVEVASAEHRLFGALATIRVGEQPLRRLTATEAGILSRALAAVASGASAEKQIFMSPIASDHEFEALAGDDGLTIRAEGCAEVLLGWPEVQALARSLAEFQARGS